MTDATTVDLRSDTVTRPTLEMYERMRDAPLGDDGLDGDPTTLELEAAVAESLGKEGALYVPSATMGNLLAVLVQAGRQELVVTEAASHMYRAERGGAALTGTFYEAVAGSAGAMHLDELADLLSDGRGKLKPALVCMETSHNNAGGAVLPLDHMRQVFELSRARHAAVHLDGARLFNAAVALRVAPAQIAACADTVTICLSKGLSAPMGGVLAGTRATIGRARGVRKFLGGTQRQVGIAAAAGLVGLRTMVPRLEEDHRRAADLARGIHGIATLSANLPQTNIVQVDVHATGAPSAEWEVRLRQQGILVRPWGASLLRCVTHRHVGDADVARALRAFALVAAELSRGEPGPS